MKLFQKIKAQLQNRPRLSLLIAAAVVVSGAAIAAGINTATQARDCDSNAIIRCGTLSTSEFKQKYKKNATGDLPAIYKHYGIDVSKIDGTRSGVVTPKGEVIVGGKVVAKNSWTVGRQANSNVRNTVKVGGTKLYERHSTATMRVNYTAFVFFDQFGRFKYAILKECGNPLIGTPTKPKASITCDTLEAVRANYNTYNFNVKYTAKNGAKATGVNINFGDGSSKELKGSYKTSHTYSKPGTYKVTATLRTNMGNKTSAGCVKQVKILSYGVAIDKTVDGVEYKEVEVGQEFTYEIVVRNTGEGTLENAVVTDNAPENVEFISADLGTVENNKWSYTIPSLAAGKSVTAKITAKVTKDVDDVIVNTACVDAKEVNGTGKSDDCDDAKVSVPEPNMIKVCDIKAGSIVEIDERDFDENKYSKDINDCYVKVCDLDSKTIVSIKKDEFDENKYSTDLSDCDDKVKVCDPSTKTIITVKSSEADDYAAPADCAETPAELPTTGLADTLVAVAGAGALTLSIVYYVASRRQLGA